MKQASVISLSGDAITIFKEIQCLTPRYVCFCLLLDVIVYMGAYDCTSNPGAIYLHARVKNASCHIYVPYIVMGINHNLCSSGLLKQSVEEVPCHFC